MCSDSVSDLNLEAKKKVGRVQNNYIYSVLTSLCFTLGWFRTLRLSYVAVSNWM